VSLPIYPGLGDVRQDMVIESVWKYFSV
jgi:hypothetical protein